MSSTQWHFNKFKDHYDFDDSPIDMVRQNEEKSCDAFGIWSAIFGKQEVTATTTQEPLDLKLESKSDKNSVTDVEKRKSMKKDRKLKNVVDKQSSKNRKDDKNAKMLKDILTENTQRRLKEGVLFDKRLEQELVAVRRQLELDKKHQQAMKEQLCQKKEEYHRQETGDEPTVEPIVGEVKTARPGAAFDLFGLLNSWCVEPVSAADGSSLPQNAPATLTKSFSGEVSIAAVNPTLRRSSGSGESGVVQQESDSSTVSDLSDASCNTTASFVATHFGASNTLHRASSVEGVTAHDIANFARFISAGGVNCDFYLPAREGDAKPMRATIKCDPESTLLQLEVSIRGPGDSSLKKVLSFDIVADVVSIVAGRGPLVAVPACASNDSLLHILLLNKPELNLGFCNMATRDVVLTALPMHLSKAKLSSKSSDSGSKPIFSISRQGRSKPLGSVGGTLMGLSANILKLTMFQFVEMKVKTLLRNGYRTRLLLVRSDGVLQFFAPPKEYETVQQTHTSSEVLTSVQLTAVAEVESRRSSLLTELQIYLQSRWDSEFLTEKGFTSELEVSFSSLEKAMSVGETEADSAVHILSKTNNICYKLKVDQAERRRALVVFLETQRKKARKAAV